MPRYRLVPQHLNDRNWRASTRTDPLEIEAKNEKHARQIASDELWIASSRSEDGFVPANPWAPNSKVLEHLVRIEAL